MICRQSRRLFSRRLDHRLSENEQQALEAHLSGCAACRAELARWEVPSRALRALGSAPVPDRLAERVWRAAMASRTPSFEERFVWAARRAAAVGVLAAGLVWGGLLWRGAGSGEATAELVLPPDAAEMAMSFWAAEPAEGALEVNFDAE